MAEVEERPHKKRRFFVDDSPVQDPTFSTEASLPDEINVAPEVPSYAEEDGEDETQAEQRREVFDADTFKAIVGAEVPTLSLIHI